MLHLNAQPFLSQACAVPFALECFPGMIGIRHVFIAGHRLDSRRRGSHGQCINEWCFLSIAGFAGPWKACELQACDISGDAISN